jgi:hypothetical protein
MPNSLFLIFNHQFTDAQRKDALSSLGVSRVVDMPPEIKAIWGDIPPELDRITDYLEPVIDWLKKEAKQGDYVLIQGDFGACYIMANYAFYLGIVPLYSTTGREVHETPLKDGGIKVTHNFRHIRFRRYEK